MIPSPDRKITELLRPGSFTLSAEIVPPRNGVSPLVIYSQIKKLTESGAQFLAVTKGAGGSLRGGSLPIAQTIKESFGVPCIAHFTCRDLLPEEVESHLIDHHFFGIRNILALRGDPPTGQADWKPREGSYGHAYKLVEQIRELNSGRYLERKGYAVGDRENTDFCIGVACYPDHPVESEGVDFLKAKVDAGAQFAISQMLFSADSYARYLDRCARSGIYMPILPGVRIVRSRAQAERMSQRFGIPVTREYLSSLPDENGSQDQALEAFMRLADEFRAKGAPGLHLFVLSETDLAAAALTALSPSLRAVAQENADVSFYG